MSSSKPSLSKRDAVYGLPTVWGVTMFVLIGAALWFSIFKQSPIDRWIAFLMIILVLLHLTESNFPFRLLEFEILPFQPPFHGENFILQVEARNPTAASSEPLWFRFRGETEWIELKEIPAHTSRRVEISVSARSEGCHLLPTLSVRTFPSTRLFRLWKVLKSSAEFFVLPPPIDHGVAVNRLRSKSEESELSFIESIVDERLLYKMDHKLFLKTGKPYYRKSEVRPAEFTVCLDWDLLLNLSEAKRGQQFSSWIQQLQCANKDLLVQVQAPFARAKTLANVYDWHTIRDDFAEWLYVKA